MGRVVSPTPTPLSSGRVVPALVASYDMHGRAVGRSILYILYTAHSNLSLKTVYLVSVCFESLLDRGGGREGEKGKERVGEEKKRRKENRKKKRRI